MRIAFITGSPFGTIGTSASYRFASEIAEKHDVIVLSPQSQASEQPIVFHDSNLSLMDIHDTAIHRQLFKAWIFLRDFDPDIVHLINHRQAYRYPFCLRHLLPNVKWVLDIRSPLLGKKNKRNKIRKRNLPLTFFVDSIFTHAQTSVRTHLPFTFRRIIETPPGVDLKLFQPVIPKEQKLFCRNFVFIGSLSPLRRLDFLINNFGNLANKTEKKIHLDIFGGGPAEKQLQHLVNAKGFEKFVCIAGAVNQNELMPKLASYDAGIAYVPNGPHETAPSLKSIEFAASGIPIFASDTPGHQSYVRRGFKFKIFSNSSESFEKVFSQALIEGVSSESIEINLKIVADHDWGTIVQKKIIPLYRQLIKNKTR